ncbi:MAG: RtcB family protein [Candidatus Micrarchaeaceae archaeon]
MSFKNIEFKKPAFRKISDVEWEIPTDFKEGMNVPVKIFATEKLLNQMDLEVFDQASNAAMLPGLINYSYVFSDGHSGYGVPVGWSGAFDADSGIISPGAIGFDIGCGMRLIKTNITVDEIKPKIRELTDMLFKTVPAGVGATSYQEPKELSRLSESRFEEAVDEGVDWAISNGYGFDSDKDKIERYGHVENVDTSKISRAAFNRGKKQLGTLGSGNHYLEIQTIDKVFDEDVAKKWGLGTLDGQVCIMVHTGSRGFGHQICTDYLVKFASSADKNGIKLIDRQLAYAPINSNEGRDYIGAMSAAINFAYLNRQLITYQIRNTFEKVFGKSADALGMEIVYDVAHNTANLEKHTIDGRLKDVIVHRKGATRSFGPGNSELIGIFKSTGQPVIVGGSMETGSFLCVGTKSAEEKTFGTTLHGSGRTMSRSKAKKMIRGEDLREKMLKEGIYVRATTMAGLAEEAGFSYKDINDVVEAMDLAGISKKVLRLRPIANVKG